MRTNVRLLGYPIVEDESVKELVLPSSVIYWLRNMVEEVACWGDVLVIKEDTNKEKS